MRSLDECLEIYRQNEQRGLEIDAHTSRSRWLGESLDYSQAIEWMQAEANAAARRTYEALGM
jgi:hypothetical protein